MASFPPLVLSADVTEALQRVYDADLGEGHFAIMLKALATPPSSTTIRCSLHVRSLHDTRLQLEGILSNKYKEKGIDPPSIDLFPDLDDVLVIRCEGL